MTEINSKTPMEKLTEGGTIYTAGNAREFKTGDWRSTKPVYLSEKCKQCGLCFPVCPDDAIPVGKDQKEQTLTMIIVRVVEYVQRCVLLEQSKCNEIKQYS